jgi:hypothetical protein
MPESIFIAATPKIFQNRKTAGREAPLERLDETVAHAAGDFQKVEQSVGRTSIDRNDPAPG